MSERRPLTALEEYFLLEDRPAYPWSFFVRLVCTGRADRQAVETALRHSVVRHPLLSSVVQQQGDGSWVWQRVEQPQPAVVWSEGTGSETFAPATRQDISAEIGVRLHAAAGSDGTQLVFQFHHACCDARGAFTWIEDWLAEYARATGAGRELGLPREYDPDLLDRRGRPELKARHLRGAVAAHWAGLLRAYRFLRQSPVPLLDYEPGRDDEPAPAGFPAAKNFRFDAATTAQLRTAAKRRQATLNDLLCCDLLLVLRDFQQGAPPPRPDGWLRLAVPVDLRTQAQENMSAANQASMVFVTRRASVCTDAAGLLQSIHRELQQVKDLGLAHTFLRSLQIRQRLPGGLARSVRKTKCGSTAALTNVGETLENCPLPRLEGKLVAGNLVLDAADFLAPIRPLTCASVAACTCAGQLSVSLQYDPRALSGTAADRLFEAFLGQLRNDLR
ncbi:MAG: hypothetical protein GX575_17885 [Candidatus Anammoximicrobium sp.]|mgnify:CR=1 FL=1|nr:hypothetical protein [Candidatus Anammoximicrobium sp.]